MSETNTENLKNHAQKECDALWAKCASKGLQEHEKTALTLLSEWLLRQEAK